MPDIHQPGPVISLPLLSTENEDRLEADLAAWTLARPLALMLPCHVRDLESEAMKGIIETLAGVPWISRVVVGLDGADGGQYEDAVRRLSVLKMPCEVLHHHWTTSPPGKGRNLGDCADRLLQSGNLFAVAMHDCDIRTYSRGFLARMCWPVLHPEAGIRACKGYYARNAGRLHGRVFRLMFQPLLRALAELEPEHPWLTFLQAMRYPLSGELCVETELLKRLTFDSGWGVEVSLLHGLYRHAGPRAICQAELCTAYDHRHHGGTVLAEMAGEVSAALTHTVEIETGHTCFDPDTLLRRFEALAEQAVRESGLTAQMNGLEHDQASEAELAVRLAGAVRDQMTRR